MTQLNDRIWAIGILDTVINFKSFAKAVKNEDADVPVGRFQFLFTTKTATEEDAKKMVRELPVGARYENYNGDFPVWYHTCKESLKSLLRSKGLDPNKNYAIIEKLSSDE